MLVVPQNGNVVVVSMIQTGCCKAEFDRTYPVHLNGIISQQEFHESIERINRSISSRTLLLVSIIFAIVFLLVGFILFIAGGITSVSARKTGFPILIGVAIAIFLFGMILLPVCLIFSQSKRMSELQKAILEESIKYSSRSVSPCSWRLNTNRFYTGFYNNRRVQTVYQILIEIGQRPNANNYSAPIELRDLDQTKYSNAPPPYNQFAQEFCSHCGSVQSNPTGNFCSTCGQPIRRF